MISHRPHFYIFHAVGTCTNRGGSVNKSPFQTFVIISKSFQLSFTQLTFKVWPALGLPFSAWFFMPLFSAGRTNFYLPAEHVRARRKLYHLHRLWWKVRGMFSRSPLKTVVRTLDERTNLASHRVRRGFFRVETTRKISPLSVNTHYTYKRDWPCFAGGKLRGPRSTTNAKLTRERESLTNSPHEMRMGGISDFMSAVVRRGLIG